MCRVHPNRGHCSKCKLVDCNNVPGRFTVWKKSSMSFQGTDGFTVFDHHGRLVFRVDNYSRNKHLSDGVGLVLMDGVGNPLLTLRPQVFSMQCRWNAYRGEYRVFAVMRRMRSLLTLSNKDDQVDIFLRGSPRQSNPVPDFVVEGSFSRRNCIVRMKSDGAVVARITRKRAKAAPTVVLGDDVFSLVVQPGFDPELIMGFVLVLDRDGAVVARIAWKRAKAAPTVVLVDDVFGLVVQPGFVMGFVLGLERICRKPSAPVLCS